MKNSPARLKAKRKPQISSALGSYLAITAGAAAVSLPNANAEIITYNGAAVTNSTFGDTLWWDTASMTAGIYRNQSVTDRFQLQNVRLNYAYTFKNDSTINTYFGVTSSYGTSLNKLAEGETIDSSTYFSGNTWNYIKSPVSPWATGIDGTTGYVPFMFSNKSDTSSKYYGWADITFNGASGSIVLNNFAYENTPNVAITTGAVPEPSTLLLLALGGSTALLARRRRKAKQTTETAA